MISVIICAYNEEQFIAATVKQVSEKDHGKHVSEILVIDGGSADETVAEAHAAGAKVLHSPKRGRAAQMNFGAKHATGDIFYFLHADSHPPDAFSSDILSAVKSGDACGCYQLRFDHDHWFLKANAWFTRFGLSAFHYGDQSLFVTRSVFIRSGGFCEKHMVMEDYEFLRRVRGIGRFHVLSKSVVTSARKYLDNGIFYLQSVFVLIFFLYKLGVSQETLVSTYRRLVKQNKL
jgi:rSAM/selenodomain-associated transferase 2